MVLTCLAYFSQSSTDSAHLGTWAADVQNADGMGSPQQSNIWSFAHPTHTDHLCCQCAACQWHGGPSAVKRPLPYPTHTDLGCWCAECQWNGRPSAAAAAAAASGASDGPDALHRAQEGEEGHHEQGLPQVWQQQEGQGQPCHGQPWWRRPWQHVCPPPFGQQPIIVALNFCWSCAW